MKKTAVLLYDKSCLFELTVALEMLKMADKEIVYFGVDLEPIKSEEGLLILADKKIDDLVIEEYDSLLITGSTDAKETVENEDVLKFIDEFCKRNLLIGAISIAPIFLLKLGYLKNKKFMIGVEKHHLYEEGFNEKDLEHMVGWEESCRGRVPEKYIKMNNIITSVAFGYRQWAMAIGEELNLKTYPKSFDL